MPVADQTLTIRWATLDLKGLRGKRTLEEFGAVLGVAKNTVWRWEAGRVKPDVAQMKKLNELAEKQGYWDQWQLNAAGDRPPATAGCRPARRTGRPRRPG